MAIIGVLHPLRGTHTACTSTMVTALCPRVAATTGEVSGLFQTNSSWIYPTECYPFHTYQTYNENRFPAFSVTSLVDNPQKRSVCTQNDFGTFRPPLRGAQPITKPRRWWRKAAFVGTFRTGNPSNAGVRVL